MSKLLQLPAIISKITSMRNRSLRIVVDSNEELSDLEMQQVMCKIEKFGWFCFLEDKQQIKEEDIIKLPPLPAKEKEEKTASQRLRSRMFVYYQEKISKDKSGFNSWYETQLGKIGENYLDKLN